MLRDKLELCPHCNQGAGGQGGPMPSQAKKSIGFSFKRKKKQFESAVSRSAVVE